MSYMHLFSIVASHLQSIVSSGGYAALFVLTVLEGLPVIGMAVPGHVAILVAGFLARIGTLHLGWVIAVSVVGALLGDYAGFFLGRKYGVGLIDRCGPISS
jgi:membrane protein DedA with SNARE-associated domain